MTMDKFSSAFLSRDSICLYAIACYMLSPVRLSVHLSHGWIRQKQLKIVQPAPQGSPMTLVSPCRTSPQNSLGNIGSGGVK